MSLSQPVSNGATVADETASGSVTVSFNLSTTGSGGVLNVMQRPTNYNPSINDPNWGSAVPIAQNTSASINFFQTRGTKMYYYSRRYDSATNTQAVGRTINQSPGAVGGVSEQVPTTPIVSSITNNTTTHTVNLSNNPSSDGRTTVYYYQSTSSSAMSSDTAWRDQGTDTPSSGWQASNTFSATPGVTYYYWALGWTDSNPGVDGATLSNIATPSSSSTYYVDVLASSFGGTGGDPVTVTMGLSNTGYGATSSAPILLNPGDTVGFRYTSNTNMSSISANLFDTAHWTNTSALTLTGSYQYKTAKSTIPIGTFDEVRIRGVSSLGGGTASNTKYTYYQGNSVQPDRTISITNTSIEIATSATQFNVAFTDTSPNTNSSITEYRVRDSSGTAHESRIGPGTITVTDVPTNAGFPETYTFEARVSTANGGDNTYKSIPSATFSVIATTTASTNNPNIDTFGMAIYDDLGTAITSFAGGHSTLREIFSTTATLSTSTHTNVNTGFTGINFSNCIISIEGDGGTGTTGVSRVPATFVTISGTTHVRVGRYTSASSVKITVSQYNGDTIGAPSSYGWSIKNGSNQVVLDENSVTYGVKEIIPLNSGLSSQQLFQNDEAYFLYVQLVAGRYPSSAGLPVPALSCSKTVALIPPIISAQRHSDGSYKTVLVYLAKGVLVSDYKLAMLVTSDIATPEYYSSSADTYGAAIYNSSSDLIWHSGWRQAIVNNVFEANQFTAGTNQNGSYDVTTGSDGVTAPSLTTSDFKLSLLSQSQNLTITSGVNDMDPANSYVSGSSLAGTVRYYQGLWEDPEVGISEQFGGGLHRPAIKINSPSSVTLQMFRYSNGPTAPSSGSYGARVATSYHPQGSYVIFRIV